jgi:lipopolysaccharide export LptBFGC system permease protein LptF
MLNRTGRGTLIAIAAGVILALLFKALTHTDVGPPYLLIALVAVGIAWAADYWLERGKRKEGEK